MKHYLLVAPAWVGDAVMSHTLCQLLAAQGPNDTFTVLAPATTAPLYTRMPEITEVITAPFRHGVFDLWKRIQLGYQLRAKTFTHAILLVNSWKSALTPACARIPVRTGYVGEMRYGLVNDIRTLQPDKLPLMIQRFAALGFSPTDTLPKHLPWPALMSTLEAQAAIVQKLNIVVTRPVLALCPGAEYGPAKRWPAHYYATIARKYQENNWDVWILGSPKDTSIAHIILQDAPNCLDLTGKTKLVEAVDLIAQSTAVVTNDSGLMHVAAALKKPLVVIYGSSDPRFTPPLATEVRVLSKHLPCSPCFERICPLGHMNCLNQLMPDVVSEALTHLGYPAHEQHE